MTAGLTIGGIVLLVPDTPISLPLSLRPVAIHAIGLAIILSALIDLHRLRKQAPIDRVILAILWLAAASYAVRALLPLLFPIEVVTGEQFSNEHPYLVIAHLIGALIGMATAVALLVAIGSDVMEARVVEASTDFLTGAGNRRALEASMRAHASGRQRLAGVIALDLDRFKSVNDRFGHAAGDMLLRAVGRRLRDLADGRGEVIRVGGEEFLILVHRRAAADIDAMAGQACNVIRETQLAGALANYRPTASVGFARHPRHGSLEETLGRADAALYRAKAFGRDRVESAEDERRDKQRSLELG